MRRLALLLMLAAAPAFAADKIAIIHDGTRLVTSASRSAHNRILNDLLARGGQPFDVYNSGVRTWNLDRAVTLKADSTWFRERYAAILVPYLDGGTGTIAPTWGTNFVNGAGTAGIQHSPLSGRWTIGTHVLYLRDGGAASGAYDENTNAWVPGWHATAAMPRGRPAQATRGTWGYKMLCRFRGSSNDTLYTDASSFACMWGTWAGNGTVAMLVWADTSNVTAWGGSCGAADSLGSMWRFRPIAGLPGITYSLLPVYRISTMDGVLAGLQMVYAQTTAEPQRRIEIPLVIHNDYAGTLNAATKAHVRAIHETLLVNRIPWAMMLTQTAASDFVGPHDADTRAELRRVLADSRARVTWAPGSNASGHDMAFFTAADTVEVRKAFNADMNTAARSDSFALPKSRMSLARFVTAAGTVGAWQAKVLADAGVKTIESTSAAGANWALLGPTTTNGGPVLVAVPGENRTLYVGGTIGITDGANLTTLSGGGHDDYVGTNFTSKLSWAAQTYASLYWHMSTQTDGTDGYFRWFASVLARHFKFYDRVIVPSNGENSDQSVQEMP